MADMKCPGCEKPIPNNHWCCKACLPKLINNAFTRFHEGKIARIEAKDVVNAEIERLKQNACGGYSPVANTKWKLDPDAREWVEVRECL